MRFFGYLLLAASLILTSCVGPRPIEEYSLAREAMMSARKSGAASFSPGYYHKAEEFYRQAKKFYDDRHYNDARNMFFKAQRYAERAENATRLKKFESGEDYP